MHSLEFHQAVQSIEVEDDPNGRSSNKLPLHSTITWHYIHMTVWSQPIIINQIILEYKLKEYLHLYTEEDMLPSEIQPLMHFHNQVQLPQPSFLFHTMSTLSIFGQGASEHILMSKHYIMTPYICFKTVSFLNSVRKFIFQQDMKCFSATPFHE